MQFLAYDRDAKAQCLGHAVRIPNLYAITSCFAYTLATRVFFVCFAARALLTNNTIRRQSGNFCGLFCSVTG